LNTWLSKADNAKYVNRIEAAIFLDSLGSSHNLNLDVYNTDNLEQNFDKGEFLDIFNHTTRLYDISYKVGLIPYPVFSKKFPVVRISGDNSGEFTIKETPLIDSHFDEKTFEKNVLFLTEFLIKAAYNIKKDFPVFDHSYIDHEYMRTAVNFFRSSSRFPTAITKDSTFSQDLFRTFSEVVRQPVKTTYTYASPKFYSSKIAKLSVTRTSSAFMDLYIFGGVLTYLWVLYTLLNKQTSISSDRVSRDEVQSASRAKSNEPNSGSRSASRSKSTKKD